MLLLVLTAPLPQEGSADQQQQQLCHGLVKTPLVDILAIRILPLPIEKDTLGDSNPEPGPSFIGGLGRVKRRNIKRKTEEAILRAARLGEGGGWQRNAET